MPWRIQSLFSVIRYTLREYGFSSYMKVIGSRSRSWEQKGRKSLFPHFCKTSIVNNSDGDVCVQYKIYGYGGSNGVTAIFVMWPEVVTPNQKYTHSLVFCLRLAGNLVFSLFSCGSWLPVSHRHLLSVYVMHHVSRRNTTCRRRKYSYAVYA